MQIADIMQVALFYDESSPHLELLCVQSHRSVKPFIKDIPAVDTSITGQALLHCLQSVCVVGGEGAVGAWDWVHCR